MGVGGAFHVALGRTPRLQGRHLPFQGLRYQAALDDKALAKDVADWKEKFFRVKDREGNVIAYGAAISGKLQLVPDEKTSKELEADYAKIADAGVLLGKVESFEDLMARCEALKNCANAV